MSKIFRISHLLVTTLLSLSFPHPVGATPRVSSGTILEINSPVSTTSTTELTVIVNGIVNKNGDICLRVYNSEVGFLVNSSSEVKSGCTKITGSSVKTVFSGLKPGTYAVAVMDDQNGDRKLNKDFFGIPTEGFGISRDPIVSMRTGMPKFRRASFKMTQNTTIDITMKYSLDP
ncbi:hypothetical protein CEP10_14000 [Cylindrospermopsis raciborskii S07]|uniref:DUF2141 domain-containing protein n=3 Tax=Cylindrospermopsis raciborskii TaxID=77022 RepID=A0A853MFS2_9CYAN|nr:DUF2141 domain-containing protein [Cylindrospermopsis raciborskii]EFA69435.1 conserved hypothetical protein [Cylindrospermopsis raciborskii CS-505]MBA4446162.1 DUF2141 domain-containing protein [Cylindrospermopsis raciborskii CS-506_C]MBA4450400.1 DUF2141 domain-containing protein [Cylindrospermopsis raciborskii CS-506_D]MBA4457018.1 DUF2141 domain-containing protein [Cylindrospermopsis raciborskii CS-506_B]MBA4466375.1 DUF2141 domain-containing protein [Cylindrospermopsis raciborskii CS-50